MDHDLFPHYAAVFLIVFGLYGMMAKKNLVRKLISMTLVQTGVILFYVTLSVKKTASMPILDGHSHIENLNAADFVNPLPHALMLTAIVVGVSALGVGLVLIVSIYRAYQTLEDDRILEIENGKGPSK